MSKLKLLLFALFVFAPAVLLAQTDNPVVPTDPVPDYSAFGVLLITTVGGFLATVATFLVSKLIPAIPAALKPIVVVALGQLAALIQAYATHTFQNPLVGAAVTAGALVIYSVYSKMQERGMKPSDPS